MPTRLPRLLRTAGPALALASALAAAEARRPAQLVAEFCAGCHGPNLTGALTTTVPAGQAPNLLDETWLHGGDDASVLRSIRDGNPAAGMAGFAGVLTEEEQRSLVAYLRRQSRQYALGLIPATEPTPKSVAVQSERHAFRLETFAEPLDTPWGIVFLPDGSLLVSDRIGRIRVIGKDGTLQPEPVRDTPPPLVRQDGGYLDLIAHPDYARNGWLYLAYTEPNPARDASMTVVVRGRIRSGAWVEPHEIFRADPRHYYDDTSHYGCRFLFDATGHLLFSIGDRGNADAAQDLSNPLGKIHRVTADGRAAAGNPFAGRPGVEPTIWSYGHRHVQGLQFHPLTGKLWATEHGPRGGDELNRIEPGRNYGWPVISHGQPQRSENIEGTDRAGMESPRAWWTPSVAPAAIEFYHGDRFPRWKNSLLVACLVGQQLRRIETDGDRVTHQEVLFSGQGRVRDVVTGPDGLIYLALNTPGRIARLVPVE